MLVVAVLLTTVLMRVAIIGAVAYLLLPQGSLCPHCGVEMVAIRNRFFDRLLPALQRRWCLECGWNGVVRRVRSARTRTYAPRPTPRPTPHRSVHRRDEARRPLEEEVIPPPVEENEKLVAKVDQLKDVHHR